MIKTIFILAIAAVALAAPSPNLETEPTIDMPQLKPTDMSSIIPEKHVDKRQIIYPFMPYQYGYPLRYGAGYQQQYIQPIGGLSPYVQPNRGFSPYYQVGGLPSYRSLLSYLPNGL